jgi:hypothetical protein
MENQTSNTFIKPKSTSTSTSTSTSIQKTNQSTTKYHNAHAWIRHLQAAPQLTNSSFTPNINKLSQQGIQGITDDSLPIDVAVNPPSDYLLSAGAAAGGGGAGSSADTPTKTALLAHEKAEECFESLRCRLRNDLLGTETLGSHSLAVGTKSKAQWERLLSELNKL